MKLSREELKNVSAGATAVEYGNIFIAFLLKVVAYIKNLLNPAPSGGGGSGGGTSGLPQDNPNPQDPLTPLG